MYSRDTSNPAYCSMVVPPDAWRMRMHYAVAIEIISLRDDQTCSKIADQVSTPPVTPSRVFGEQSSGNRCLAPTLRLGLLMLRSAPLK